MGIEASDGMAEALHECLRFRADAVEPELHIRIASGGGDGGFGDAMGGKEARGFFRCGKAEESGVEPWLGVLCLTTERTHPLRSLTCGNESRVLVDLKMIQPSGSIVPQARADDPSPIDTARPIHGRIRRGWR